MMNKRRIAAAAALLAALLDGRPPAALAQAPASGAPTAAGPRPKVCLVLSGGGARGAAHVGVLRVLEEYRVPIDCITGTSMGALVGAAYASGMTLPEMEKLTESITTDLLFKEKPPRSELAIRRKEDEARLNLFSPEIGFTRDGETRFPKGVISGVRLESVLRELSPIRGAIKFDDLPIPFRAVATDLVTGQRKVFDRGELALAMRASMSVPGVIAPAEFDGMMLVDGALVDNMPVDVARGMGADIVIAVNVGTPLGTRENIKDVLGVTAQVIGILTEQNVLATLASLKPTDVLIVPELGTFSAGDFDNMKSTFPIGDAAARKVAGRLQALSLPPERYAAFQAGRTRTVVASTRPVDEIRFDPAPSRVNPEYLETILDTKAGEPLDQGKLDRDLLRLYGTGDFEHVSYSLIETPAKRILNVQAVEKSWGPNYLRLGLGLSADFRGNSFFDLQGEYRRTWLNSYGGEWYNEVVLGRNSRIYSEFYQPLDARQRFFVAPQIQLARNYLEVFEGKSSIGEYSIPTGIAGIDVGTQFTRYGEVRLGLFGGATRAEVKTGVGLPVDTAKTTLAGVRLRAYFDQLDSATFPRDGYAASIELLSGLDELGSDFDYDRWEVSATIARSFDRHTFSVAFRGTGPIEQRRTPLYVATPWGGFLQQSGFKTGQLLNDRFAFGRLVYAYRLLTLPLLEGVFVGLSGEVGDYGRPLLAGNPTGTLYSGSAFVVADSPIGPIYLGYGIGSGGNRGAYFYLGRP